MKNFLNSMKSLIIAVSLLAGSSTAEALTTYSAPFQGLTFTFTEVDANTLLFEIDGTPSGDWATADYLAAFSFKDLGLDFETVTGTANGPGATNLAGLNSELSASSIDCASPGSPKGAICFDIDPDTLLPSAPFALDYTIDFSAPFDIGSAGPHLKIAFTETQNGPKIGSLYSENVPESTTNGPGPGPGSPGPGPGPGGQVPEPAPLLLFGSGLLLTVAARRRFSRETK